MSYEKGTELRVARICFLGYYRVGRAKILLYAVANDEPAPMLFFLSE